MTNGEVISASSGRSAILLGHDRVLDRDWPLDTDGRVGEQDAGVCVRRVIGVALVNDGGIGLQGAIAVGKARRARIAGGRCGRKV